jgi:arsenate reductase
MAKQVILFLCTHNSARSQMAEGLLNHLRGDRYQAYSAGVEPAAVHPMAIKVMSEIGIDISSQRSKHARLFVDQDFDIVVTVCDSARESCPFFPGAKESRHQNFPDPSSVDGTETEKLAVFLSTRDAIHAWSENNFS